MNIIELLMAEHAALRLHFGYLRSASFAIYEIEDFVRNCHAKIEDELVFPELGKILEIKQAISRLEADHKLIDVIGDQIRQRTVQGDMETLKKRVELYASAVASHNASEESLIFGYWKGADVILSARKIIEDFGFGRYFAITGISEKLLDRLG